MPIRQSTCFTAVCDHCQRSYENCDSITLHFGSYDEALGEAESYDWNKMPDGRVFCDDCTYRLVSAGVIKENEDAEGDAPRFLIVEQTEAQR